MTALSADLVSPRKHDVAASTGRSIVNTAVMYKDAITALCTKVHGTAASRGRVKPAAFTAGEFIFGRWGQGKTTGDTSASVMQTGQVQIDDQVVGPVTCAGLASSEFQRDTLEYVYCGDDNMHDALTLTRPTSSTVGAVNDRPVGLVWGGYSATQCYVLMFGFRTRMLMDMCGGPIQTWCLGAVGAETPSAQNLLTGIVMPFRGRFIEVFTVCVNASTDADWAQLLNLEIDGTNVTGGVVTMATADAQGDKQAGTAITAANEFSAGSLIDVEAATVTAGTANNGLYNLYVRVEMRLGL